MKANCKKSSELRTLVSEEIFEQAFKKFVEQADKNAITKKSQGSKVPYGFTKKVECDGAAFGLHYGQGAASRTPYVNWWVVSIYYIPDQENIFMGIEEERYPHLNKMHPIRYQKIGNKKINIAVFYSATKRNIDYKELYDTFMDTCEEVMKLGLK